MILCMADVLAWALLTGQSILASNVPVDPVLVGSLWEMSPIQSAWQILSTTTKE